MVSYISEIEIIEPDDFHHHFRDGDVLPDVVKFAARSFCRVLAMPNLKPPIRNLADAINYRDKIMSHVPTGTNLELLMTIYLTDTTTPAEMLEAKQSGIVYAAKLYPAGATTNSEHGVTSIEKIDNVLKTMAEIGMPLLVHGEVTDSNIDIFDREQVFIDRILGPLISKHQTLKVVMEHITTSNAVAFVKSCSSNVAATITAHHLLYNRNALFTGGICPHMYCLPILKREEHREALLEAATSGSPKFFLGTDSAPHAVGAKESACGCAGIFTGHAAIELYAEAFDSVGEINKLENFASVFGAEFYEIPISKKKVKLLREEWQVPESFSFGSSLLRPLRAGEMVKWKKDEP